MSTTRVGFAEAVLVLMVSGSVLAARDGKPQAFDVWGFERNLRVANRMHDLVALCVQDPRESELPPVGMIALEDAETGQVQVVDTGAPGLREAFRQAALHRQKRLRELFRSLSMDAVELSSGQPYDLPLVRFFEERARRAR